jgi:macrolide transport system ATP-binding/permease protein
MNRIFICLNPVHPVHPVKNCQRTMSLSFLKFHNVTFGYETALEPLFQDVSIHFVPGWSGVVGANGVGKTTLLKLATGLLAPDHGSIDVPQDAIYCPQRTDDIPEKFDELLWSDTKAAGMIKSRLGISEDWIERWPTLSHGERKRAQLAVALWLQPTVLAVDEPTNHVDAEAREIIAHALQEFDGIGLLVSHDRDLLDALCQHCLFLEPPDVTIRPGGYTQGTQTAQQEQASLRKQQILNRQMYKRLHKEFVRRNELAQQYQRKRSKRGIAKNDHDAKGKVDQARMTNKDVVGGKLQRQIEGRLTQAMKAAEEIKVKKQYNLGIWLPGSLSKRDFLVKMPAGSLFLGETKQLVYPDLAIKPADRIAITGPNGAGKSTLIRHLLPLLNVPQEHIAYVPQEIDVRQSQDILAQVQALPHEQLGHLMTIVSRLGSRPHRLLDSTEPSPGETRKLLLALGMTYAPHIIIMDEPTNHMDLPSIECLEQALADCPCGLVLVSHDRRFLKNLMQHEWNITEDTHLDETFVVQMLS